MEFPTSGSLRQGKPETVGVLWAAQFLLSVLLPFPIGLIVGSLVSTLGSYLVRSTVEPDLPVITGRQIGGQYLDIVVQTILGVGIEALAGAALAGPLGLMLFAFFMILMATIDWLVYFYAMNWHDRSSLFAMQRTLVLG